MRPASRPAPRPGPGCGSCVPTLKTLLADSGVARRIRRCASTSTPPAPSFRDRRGQRASARSGAGRPGTAGAGAATSASPPWPRSWPAWSHGHILDGEQAALQDTNDHFLANIQRNGTYSVVPRIPGGEITPDEADRPRRGRPRLRPVHQDHRRAADRPVRRRVEQLPGDLAAAGGRRVRVRARLRQGAAHGEVLRRIDLVPLRRAGLGRRSRSSLSCATGASAHRTRSRPGCPAAPASAPRPGPRTSASSPPRHGWNLYVGGNGGFRPAARRAAAVRRWTRRR